MRYGSVCSGIEAATSAWHSLGWVPSFFSEIEEFPRRVLEHHYPDVPLHGDFTTIGADEYGSIDLLVGGTPCQSFSVAGLRGGMDDERGNLALEYLKLAQRKRPRWLVWENVPGVLSSNGGRDFGAFLGGLVELGYGFAYRVLDAQYFGVAQRRRRVFVVGCLGDWRRAAAVLFERESLSGNPAPSREAREEATSAAEAGAGERGAIPVNISGGNKRRGRPGGGFYVEEHPETSRALDSASGLHPNCGQGGTAVIASACAEVAPAVTTGPPFSRTGNERVECEAIVPVTARMRGFGDYECDGAASALKARDYKDATDLVAYGFQSTANAGDAAAAGENVSPSLRAADPMAVAFAQNSRDELREMPYAGALAAQPGIKQASHIREGLSVRRLTPTECERLQGFPDNFTQIPYRNKPAEKCSDGPRYKALGNSMAVPVMRWIGKRIQQVEEMMGD